MSSPILDPTAALADLTLALVNIPSVSGHETAAADAVEAALRTSPHLEVLRDGDAVVGRTNLGRPRRVIIAGHIDTVPVADNLPGWLATDPTDGTVWLWGRGSNDMKAGAAVMLALAAELVEPAWDVTWVFYDHEEVDAALNGLGRLARNHPDWLAGDFAVLTEPTAAEIEGGCNGTCRVEVTVRGLAAHSARAWLGRNAIHLAAPVLARLNDYVPDQVEVDGLVYREGLNAVGIVGGIAGNVVPDRCTVTVNYRFAPSKTAAEAVAHLRQVFDGFEVEVSDAADGACPGLGAPVAAGFVAVVQAAGGGPARPKEGWTDVARFSALGIPAVNFGPGDPSLAHADDERCPISQMEFTQGVLRAWLTAASA